MVENRGSRGRERAELVRDREGVEGGKVRDWWETKRGWREGIGGRERGVKEVKGRDEWETEKDGGRERAGWVYAERS